MKSAGVRVCPLKSGGRELCYSGCIPISSHKRLLNREARSVSTAALPVFGLHLHVGVLTCRFGPCVPHKRHVCDIILPQSLAPINSNFARKTRALRSLLTDDEAFVNAS